MNKVFHIPSHDHLVKFAEKEFWDGMTPPFPINEGTLLGKQLFSVLIDHRKHDLLLDEFESELKLELSDTLAKRSPDLVKLSRINRFLEELFKRCMIIWVKAQMQIGSNRYQAVLSFLRYYQLERSELIDRYYLYIKRCSYIPYRISQNEKEKNGTKARGS